MDPNCVADFDLRRTFSSVPLGHGLSVEDKETLSAGISNKNRQLTIVYGTVVREVITQTEQLKNNRSSLKQLRITKIEYFYTLTIKKCIPVWWSVLFCPFQELNKGAVTLRNFLGNLSRNTVAMKVAEKIIALSHCNFLQQLATFWAEVSWEPESRWRISENAHALTANVTRKLQQKLLEGWNTVQWRWKLLQCVAKSRLEFYFVQRSVQQKKLRDDPCYTVQFTSNLCRKRRCETSCWENSAVKQHLKVNHCINEVGKMKILSREAIFFFVLFNHI